MSFTDDIIARDGETALDRIDQLILDEYNGQQHRDYLGCSAIGHPCDHKLFYDFRWASESDFDVDTCRRFDDGHRVEAYLVSQFEKADIGFEAFDENGNQFAVSDIANHLRGHLDGLCYNLPNAKGPVIWECKATDEKNFNQFVKLTKEDSQTALMEWNEQYYAQAQLYMRYTGIEQHWLTVATPGARKIAQVFTEYDEGAAINLISRASRIITSRTLAGLTKISNSASWWQCKFCDHTNVCHYGERMKAHCRSCEYAMTDIGAGGWRCTLHNEQLDLDRQRVGCDKYQPLRY